MSLSWSTPSEELIGPIVATEFPVVVWSAIELLYSLDSVQESLKLYVALALKSKGIPNPAVTEVFTVFVDDFEVDMVSVEPTRSLLP